MQIFKWIKPLSFLFAIIIVNSLLTFLIVPVRGASGTMWEEYYQEDDLDTIFIGASFCAATFEPYIFNEQLGVKSFNLGTPLQAIGQTMSAVETVTKDFEINTIIIGMGFFSLQQGSYDKAELTFERAKAEKKGGIEGILEGFNYVFSEEVRGTEKSIQYFLPWLYNQEEVSLSFISKNVAAKMEEVKRKEGNMVSRKGYRYYDDIVDYKTKWERNSYEYYSQKLDAELMRQFAELLVICKKNAKNVIVVNTPHPTYDVVSCYETYAANEKQVNTLCESYGVAYYNFSLVKPEFFELKDEYFYDFEHLNKDGSEAFCKALCEFLERKKSGEEMESYFYTVEEYLDIHGELLEDFKASH